MSVAKCLGVDDLDRPPMSDVRARWPQWGEVEPVLGLVDSPAVLPMLMHRLEPSQRDEVLAAVVRLGVVETEATVALVWLLVPGASRLARRIGDLSGDIDELVAGELWIQSRQQDPEDARYVAAKILKRTEREVKAELGIGDLARRRDETWANTVPVDRFTEAPRAAEPDPADVSEQLGDLLQQAIDSGVLTDADRDLLLDLAHAAHRLGAPLRRGRGGLTTPSVAEMVAADHALAVRSIRRHAASAIDKIRDAGRPG